MNVVSVFVIFSGDWVVVPDGTGNPNTAKRVVDVDPDTGWVSFERSRAHVSLLAIDPHADTYCFQVLS